MFDVSIFLILPEKALKAADRQARLLREICSRLKVNVRANGSWLKISDPEMIFAKVFMIKTTDIDKILSIIKWFDSASKQCIDNPMLRATIITPYRAISRDSQLKFINSNNMESLVNADTFTEILGQILLGSHIELLENKINDCIIEAISIHRKVYLNENYPQFVKFNDRINAHPSDTDNEKQEEKAKGIIQNYIKMYPRLEKYLFIIEMWARAARVLHDDHYYKEDMSQEERRDHLKDCSSSRLKWYHLSLMVIMVATKRIGSLQEIDSNNGNDAIIETFRPPSDLSAEEPIINNGHVEFDTTNPIDDKHTLSDADLSRLTIAFFRYLSSQEFSSIKKLEFETIGLPCVFLRYHESAIRTYLNLLLNMRLEELPIKDVQLERLDFDVVLCAEYNILISPRGSGTFCSHIETFLQEPRYLLSNKKEPEQKHRNRPNHCNKEIFGSFANWIASSIQSCLPKCFQENFVAPNGYTQRTRRRSLGRVDVVAQDGGIGRAQPS